MVCEPRSDEPEDVSKTLQPLTTSCLSVVVILLPKLISQWKTEGVVGRNVVLENLQGLSGSEGMMTAFGGDFDRQG